MKKWFSIAAAVVLCLALVIGIACGGEEDEEGVTELKFGFGVPLTGFVSLVGTATRVAMEMAAEDIGVFEVGGEQYRWKCYYEDNKYSTEGGVASTNKLIFERGVDFVLQSGDVPGIPAAMITEEIPMILEIGAGSASLFGPDLPHTFLAYFCWDLSHPVTMDWVMKNHPEIKVVCITTDETPTGEASRAIWQAVCDYHGLELHSVVAPSGTVEYYPIATKMMTHDPDLIAGSFTGLTEAMWDFGYDGMVITSFFPEAAAKRAGWDKHAEKNRFGTGHIVYALHPYGGAFPKLDAIKEEYEHRTGTEFGPNAAWPASSLYVWTDALQQAGTVDDIEKIVETFESGADFESLAGPVHYGLGEYIGIPHIMIYPVPIIEMVGEEEYVVHKIYSADEAEAVFLEIYRGR